MTVPARSILSAWIVAPPAATSTSALAATVNSASSPISVTVTAPAASMSSASPVFTTVTLPVVDVSATVPAD